MWWKFVCWMIIGFGHEGLVVLGNVLPKAFQEGVKEA